MAKNYKEMSEQILKLIGTKDNISFLTHCITRLRFELKDQSLVKADDIKKIHGVTGTNWTGNQFQIIIGSDVEKLYDEVCQQAGLKKQAGINENLDADVKHKFSVMDIFSKISQCVIPLIPVLVAVGMVQFILAIVTMTNLVSPESGTYVTLTFAANAGFYFLPIFVGLYSARAFGASEGLGMLIGAIFLHPTFTAMIANGSGGSIFGLPIPAATYPSTILPAIASVFVMSIIEKFLKKHVKGMFASFITSFIVMLIMIPLSLVVIGPAGSYFTDIMAAAIDFLYNKIGFIGVALHTVLTPFLVMTGLHMAGTPIVIQQLTDYGMSVTMMAASVSCLSIGAATLAIGVKTKNSDLKATALSAGITNCVMYIQEPALYGVILDHKKGLYGALIGNFVGGGLVGLLQIGFCSFPYLPGIFQNISLIGDNMSNLFWGIAILAVTFVVSFGAAFILYKDEK